MRMRKSGDLKNLLKSLVAGSFSIRQCIVTGIRGVHYNRHDQPLSKEIARKRVKSANFSLEELKEALRHNEKTSKSIVYKEFLNGFEYTTSGGLKFRVFQDDEEWFVDVFHPEEEWPEDSSLLNSLTKEDFDTFMPLRLEERAKAMLA